MAEEDPRAALDRLIRDNNDDYVSLSRMLGRNAAYVQQFIKRGSPKRLPERERSVLARYFGVDERVLGKTDDTRGRGLRLVPKLAVGASAGGGALTDAEALAGRVGFDETWLRQMGLDPARLSLIRVNGQSMLPTLNDGDDIMVDSGTGASVAKSGVYVLRFDGTLMVKRLMPHIGGVVSILSDNPDYPPIDNVPAGDVTIIGRVVWVGRKL
jgi:phage repressor protein C with HTH and peptisase S24 domain